MNIYVCQPLTADLKRYYGEELHLRESHARKLEREGKIKIVKLHDVLSRVKGIDNICAASKAINLKKSKKYITSIPADMCHDIPVYVPFVPNGKIGKAYNDIMQSVKDWVIFIDHDVLLGINPYWYEICNNAIATVGHIGGWFSCYTNRIGCALQKAPDIDQNTDDIRYHQKYACSLYKNNRGKIIDVTSVEGKRFSGMFILTHKQAWKDAGGFPEDIGFFGVDCEYYSRLKRAGYRTYVLKDLYVYHAYFRETLKPIFKSKGDFECQEKVQETKMEVSPQVV